MADTATIRQRETIDDVAMRGDYAFMFGPDGIPHGLVLRCVGCGQETAIPFASHTDHPPSWTFDGNLECPTLAPSLMCRCCSAHGWIRQGLWVGA